MPDTARATDGPSPPAPPRLWLEVDPGTTPISGRLGVGQRQWAFAGWLELAAALDTAILSGGRTP